MLKTKCILKARNVVRINKLKVCCNSSHEPSEFILFHIEFVLVYYVFWTTGLIQCITFATSEMFIRLLHGKKPHASLQNDQIEQMPGIFPSTFLQPVNSSQNSILNWVMKLNLLCVLFFEKPLKNFPLCSPILPNLRLISHT